MRTNLTHDLFPDPLRRGIVIEPVCMDIEFHIWRLLLDLIARGENLNLTNRTSRGFQDGIPRQNQTFLLHNSKFGNQQVAVTGDTPSVITFDFPGKGTYIMRSILGESIKLSRAEMLKSLIKRKLNQEKQDLIRSEIEKAGDLWFANVFLVMLSQAGLNLTSDEQNQLMANIRWFNQTFIR